MLAKVRMEVGKVGVDLVVKNDKYKQKKSCSSTLQRINIMGQSKFLE